LGENSFLPGSACSLSNIADMVAKALLLAVSSNATTKDAVGD
jgi:hypothetical protein